MTPPLLQLPLLFPWSPMPRIQFQGFIGAAIWYVALVRTSMLRYILHAFVPLFAGLFPVTRAFRRAQKNARDEVHWCHAFSSSRVHDGRAAGPPSTVIDVVDPYFPATTGITWDQLMFSTSMDEYMRSFDILFLKSGSAPRGSPSGARRTSSSPPKGQGGSVRLRHPAPWELSY